MKKKTPTKKQASAPKKAAKESKAKKVAKAVKKVAKKVLKKVAKKPAQAKKSSLPKKSAQKTVTKKKAASKAKTPSKKVVEKAAKPVAKKVAKKKVVKKAVTKKAAPKKEAAPKETTSKKPVTKKAAAKAAAQEEPKQRALKKSKKMPIASDKNKDLMLSARKRTQTPSIFKVRSRKHTPIVFTLEEVRELIQARKDKAEEQITIEEKVAKKAKQEAVEKAEKEAAKKRVLGAASLSDILGFSPGAQKHAPKPFADEESKVLPKYKRYYKALIDLRGHVLAGLEVHTQETLKRSSKEDSGDLSGYGQHMADAGTDNSDRDFALSLVSSEQEALFEIEEAIQRILKDEYGVCEITGEAIAKERLLAVPFTRYSLAGRQELERSKRRTTQSGNPFSEVTVDEVAKFGDEDFE